MRLLIADDERGFAAALAEVVQSCGHTVVEVVFSGLGAIRAYQRHRPDLVLMDYNMGRLNGLTACRNIVSSDPAARIVFLSGVGAAEELPGDLGGAVGFLRKPVKMEELQQLLASFEGPGS